MNKKLKIALILTTLTEMSPSLAGVDTLDEE